MAYLLATLLVLSSGPLPAAYSRDQHRPHGGQGANHGQVQRHSQPDTGRGKGNAKPAKNGQHKKPAKHKKNTKNSHKSNRGKGRGKSKSRGQNKANAHKSGKRPAGGAQSCQTRGNSDKSKRHPSKRHGNKHHQKQSAARQRQDKRRAEGSGKRTSCDIRQDPGRARQNQAKARDLASANAEPVAPTPETDAELPAETVPQAVAVDVLSAADTGSAPGGTTGVDSAREPAETPAPLTSPIARRDVATTEPAPGDHRVPEVRPGVEATAPPPGLPVVSTPTPRPALNLAASTTPVAKTMAIASLPVVIPASTITTETLSVTPTPAADEAVRLESHAVSLLPPITPTADVGHFTAMSPTVAPAPENPPLASVAPSPSAELTGADPVSSPDQATPASILLPEDKSALPAATAT
jgi:hypothetical protein